MAFLLTPISNSLALHAYTQLKQGFSLAELLLITFCALLLKLDLTGADAVSVQVFDILLIVSNAVVVLGIMPASFFVQVRHT